MPWNLNLRHNLHCGHTFWNLKLKIKDFSKFQNQYSCTIQTTACMYPLHCAQVEYLKQKCIIFANHLSFQIHMTVKFFMRVIEFLDMKLWTFNLQSDILSVLPPL